MRPSLLLMIGCALLALVLLLPGLASAQPWSGILAANRGTNWTTAGVAGGVPTTWPNCDNANCAALMAAGTVSVATIQAAVNGAQVGGVACSASSPCVVRLRAGSFSMGGLALTKSGVVLRGQGADQTKLNFTGTTTCSYTTVVCLWDGSGVATGPLNMPRSATWTAGYTKGTTAITLSNATALAVGMQVILDQLDDTATDTTEIWNCPSATVSCMTEDVVTFGRSGRQGQVHMVTVVACSPACGGAGSTVVTITPGLHMNYKSARTPGAGWWNTQPTTLAGIENMTLDIHSSGVGSLGHGVSIERCRDCWLKGVRIVNVGAASAPRCVTCLYWTNRVTIRDSYLYGDPTQGSLTHYGVEIIDSSDNLIENTIFEAITGPLQGGQGNQGTVWGYNYALNDTYCPFGCPSGWMQASSYNHAIGNNYNLYEGNDGIGQTCDAIHGPSYLNTVFRNRYRGFDPDGGSSGGKTDQLVAVHLYRICRYFNAVGNVLGEPGKHTQYEGFPTSASSNANPTANIAIYQLGWAANQDGGGTSFNDVRVRDTMMRWGNWDVVTGTRFLSAEVPTGDSFYPNTVPASQTLPTSFYLAAKPAWFGSVTWPAIGPDVTGGNMTAQNLAGHVYKIPARLCYEAMADDPAFAGATVRTFNAGTCYAGGAAPAQPAAPTNLRLQ